MSTENHHLPPVCQNSAGEWVVDHTELQNQLESSLSDLALENSRLTQQLIELRAERDCLVERLRGSPELREVVRDLKQILRDLDDGLPAMSRRRLERLLRRLDTENL